MQNKLITAFLMVALALFVSCQQNPPDVEHLQISYPETKKVNQVDDYFGTSVADPYRWLEDDNAEDVQAWVQEQNTLTFGYLEQIPFREKIRQRISDLYNYPKYSSPSRVGEYYFFNKNDGLQNQSVIYIQKGLDGDPEVFIDPNELSPDGTIRIGLLGASKDNAFMAISRSEAGSDWREIRIMEVATKRELEDRLQWVKFSGASWQSDGFYYNRYDEPEPGQELTAQNQFQKVFYHMLGTSQEEDVLIHEDKDHPLRIFSAGVTEDERYLFLIASEGTSGNEVYYRDLYQPKMEFRPLIKGFDTDSYPIENAGDKFLFYTNCNAPNYRIVLIDPNNPAKENWTDIIPEQQEVLSGASTAGGSLFCTYLKDANTKVLQYSLEGQLTREIELPTLGSAYGFYGKKEDTTLFYTFTSFTYPPTIFKHDIPSGTSEVFRQSEVQFTPEDYVTEQIFYSSKDGTRIPMFIVYKKGLKKNGKNPTLLTGYGGFNISETPNFSATRIFLLENGGIFALANLRGGGEYGEEWHKAGMLLNKQNVFDDFIAAGEFLVAEKFTSKDYLAIAGASNGGLLVGACMTQRPDLFKVALPAVGVMDMLRYHKFTIGWAWAVDYGSSDEEQHFNNLYSYSPLHNIKDGISYPATLVTTADHDDRVVPAHSFKFIATLQERHVGSNPVLIRIETRSGHGSSSTSKMIEELADEYAFMFYNMGIKLD